MYSKYNQFNIFTNIFHTSKDRQGQREASTLLHTYVLGGVYKPRRKVRREGGLLKYLHYLLNNCYFNSKKSTKRGGGQNTSNSVYVVWTRPLYRFM